MIVTRRHYTQLHSLNSEQICLLFNHAYVIENIEEVAAREGFEPSVQLPTQRFSRTSNDACFSVVDQKDRAFGV